MPAGTIYDITLKWTSEKKTVTWEPLPAQDPEEESPIAILGANYQHEYFVVGTWSEYKFQKMLPSKDGEGFDFAMTIGFLQREEFQIVRDRDMNQVYHPAHEKTMKPGCPIKGPDDKGKGKYWMVKGPQHEKVLLNFKVVDGKATVTLKSPVLGERVWESFEAWAQGPQQYHIVGSFTGWQMAPMVMDEAGVFTHRVVLDDGYGMFQVVVDEDASMVMYPGDDRGLLGPDAEATNSWVVAGKRGVYDIKLDVKALRRKDMVSWELVEEIASLEA